MVNHYGSTLSLPQDPLGLLDIEPDVGPIIGAAIIDWTLLVPEQRFVLVVDRSSSMAGDKLNEAKNGAAWWVDNYPDLLEPADYEGCGDFPPYRFGVVAYSHEVSVVNPLQFINDDEDREDIHERIDDIESGGLTAIGDGLRAGLNQILDAGDRAATQVIVLLTDGFHNFGENPSDVLPDLIENGVRVYTIGIGSNTETTALLQEIATSTGGNYYAVDPTRTIIDVMTEISGISKENGGLVTSITGSTNLGWRWERRILKKAARWRLLRSPGRIPKTYFLWS